MKVKSVSWSVLYLAIVIGIQLMVVVAMGVFVGIYVTATMSPTVSTTTGEDVTVIIERVFQNGNFTMLLSLMIFVVLFAIFGFWYYFSMKKENHYSTGVVPKTKHVIFAIVIAFFSQAVAECILVGTSKIIPKMYQNYVELIENATGGDINPYLMTIVIVFIGPIVEEIIFRGMVFRVLRKGYGFTCSAMIGALLFAIYHLNLVQGIYCFAFGWVLCFLYEKSKSLSVVIIAHMTFNASTFGWQWAMELFSNKYPDYPWWYDVIIWVISFGIVLIMMLNLKNERGISNDTSSFEQ